MTTSRIVAWVVQNFKLGDRRRSVALGQMVSGLIKAGVVSFAAIGRAMEGLAKKASNIRRVFEFCHNDQVSVVIVQESLVRLLAGQVAEIGNPVPGLVTVAMDWHLYDHGDISALRVSLLTGTRALPLLWFEVATKDLKGRGPEIEENAIRRLVRWRPAGVQWLILLDAGFRSTKLVHLLKQSGYFILRSGSHVRVRGSHQEWTRTGELPVKTGQIVEFGWLDWNKSIPCEVRLVCARLYDVRPPKEGRRRKRPAGRYKYSKPGLCAVITNLPLDLFSSIAVIRLYARRFEIEHSFRDIKNATFGMDMEHTHLHTEAAYDRLMCIVAIAEAILWLTGVEAEEQGLHLDLTPCRPRSKRRVLSFQTVAHHCLSQIKVSISTLITKHLPRALALLRRVVGRTWKDVKEVLGLVQLSPIPQATRITRGKSSMKTRDRSKTSQPSWLLKPLPMLQVA